MASTVKSSNMILTVTEKITLNGTEHGSTNKVTISGINEISKRILTVATDPGTQIYAGASSASNGTFVTANVKYIRVTNLDNENSIILHLSNGSDHNTQFSLAAGQVFFLTDLSASFDNATTVAGFTAVDITRIDAMANTAAVDIEIIVASS